MRAGDDRHERHHIKNYCKRSYGSVSALLVFCCFFNPGDVSLSLRIPCRRQRKRDASGICRLVEGIPVRILFPEAPVSDILYHNDPVPDAVQPEYVGKSAVRCHGRMVDLENKFYDRGSDLDYGMFREYCAHASVYRAFALDSKGAAVGRIRDLLENHMDQYQSFFSFFLIY